MLIKQIYKFLQYFELVADVYKRIPAVQLDATSKVSDFVLHCFHKSVLEKWLVVCRRSSEIACSLDNGEIIITARVVRKTTYKWLQKSKKLNCCHNYISIKNT